MCHEQRWAERRMRHAKESHDVWRDFDETRPADDVPVPDDEPDVQRLDAEAEAEAVALER
jgi:hypothetical protein